MRQTYRRYGFLVSALVHLGLLGMVAWLLLAGMSPGPREAEHEVPVALSMFVPAERAAQEAQPPADDSVASPAHPTSPAEPPDPVVSPTPAEPPPKAEPPPPTEPPPRAEPQPPAEPPPKAEPAPPAEPEHPARAPAPREHAPTEPAPVAAAPVAAAEQQTAAAGPPSARRTAPSVARAVTGAGEAGEAQRERLRDAYLARLQAAIARHKYYPRLSRRRGEEGRVLLRLVIGSDGDLSEVRVARSSGKRRLDEAALKTIEQLGHAEPLPPELGLSAWRISVPMVFSLER